MKFYLSSYKFGNEIDKAFLKEWIKEHGNSLAFFEASRDCYEESDLKREKINSNIIELKELGFDITEIHLKDYFGKEDLLYEKLKEFKSLCFIGGNVFVLRMAMKYSGFDNILNKLMKEDILYMGYSAGICVLSKTLEGLDIVDEKTNPYTNEENIIDGLNVFDYTFVPHYKSDHPESKLVDEVVEYLRRNQISFKTLSDGDVIIEEK